jgi:hypothetical protein
VCAVLFLAHLSFTLRQLTLALIVLAEPMAPAWRAQGYPRGACD